MKQFLIDTFGNAQGAQLYKQQQEKLSALLAQINGKTKSQTKTLRNTILPRVALYKILLENQYSKVETLETIDQYMTQVATKISKMFKRMEHLPFFYYIFRKMFTNGAKSSDNWDVKVGDAKREYFTVLITKCLWYDACVDHDCIELCQCFCKSDDIIYGMLKKIKFVRAASFADNAKCCDFNFINTKYDVREEMFR